MFTSTVVLFVELLLLSLLGVMLYKLVSAYRKWKALSASPSQRGGDRPSNIISPTQPQSSDYLSVSKITVTEEQSSDKSSAVKDSSDILTDYIGEFFSESKQVDLEPFRLQPVDVSLSRIKVSPSAQLSDHSIVQGSIVQGSIVQGSVVQDSLFQDNVIPIAEPEPDTFITVASEHGETQQNKVMSDKVVLAMLDEAKIVRAS